MIVRVLACLVAVCTFAAPVADAAPAGGHVQFRLRDHRLDEVSGIAAGIASPGVVYVENDGGDSARFFALDASSGAVRAVYTVPGARNVDWEDIAVAPDAHGTPSVWLADIGDNDARRRSVQIYRVDEPHVAPSGRGAHLHTGAAEVWRLTYPDGPHNAESLAVSPRGVPYIVTKSLLGSSVVFAAPSTPGVSSLRRVGTIRFRVTGTPGPFAPVGQLTATGADLSRDGRVLVVRTYTDAYFWQVRAGNVAAALRTRPVRMPLPRQPQGEGICLRADRVLIDSEHVGSAVYSLPVPRSATPTRSPSAAAPPTRSSARPHPPPSAPPSTRTMTPTMTPTTQSHDNADRGTPGWVFALIGAVVAGGVAVTLRLRRR